MSTAPEAFYLPLASSDAGDDRYEPTRATESPWDRSAQHGGPPAALLAECIDRTVDGPLRLARISVDFLGPIPRTEVTVEVTAVKPGRRVWLSDAVMKAGGRPVVLARAWHVATGPRPPATGEVPERPAARPETLAQQQYFAGLTDWGYGQAIEWSFTRGGYGELGPADVWTRVTLPLVAGQPLRGLHRALLTADSANGLSATMPMGEWWSIPPTMTTTLLREPVGEWTHLAARTHLADDGIGMARAELSDETGWYGEVTQPLLVQQR